MKKVLIYSFSTLLALTSCSSEEGNYGGETWQEIAFYASLNSPAMSRASGLSHDQQIQSTDTYGMFVGDASTSTFLWDFVKMNPVSNSETGNSVQLLPEDEQKLYVPIKEPNKTYVFAAVSPYIADLKMDNMAKEFSVKTNQHYFADYCASDLCIGNLTKDIASELGATAGTTNVTVPMNHALSKILIKIVGSDSYPEAKEDIASIGINKIEVLDVKTTCRVAANTSNQQFMSVTEISTSEKSNIVVSQYYKDDYARDGVACIIPPQTVTTTNPFIRITTSAGNVWQYKLPSNLTIEANTIYKFVLALNKLKVGETTGTIQDVKVEVVKWTQVNDNFDIELNH